MKTEWFYAENNEQKGPISLDELQGLRSKGTITEATLVWRDGMTDWKPLDEALAMEPVSAAPAAPTPASASLPAAPVTDRPNSPGAAYASRYGGPAPAISSEQTPGEATASLVLGILSLACFGILTAIPGAICGHIALNKIAASKGALGGRGVAIAGLVLSYVAIVISLLAIGFIAIGMIAEGAASP